MVRLDPKMVFVVSQDGDTNTQINREISVVNFFMTAHPGHLFLCRGSFLLIELQNPRPNREWADFQVALVSRCDALYCVDDDQRHPLAVWAIENDLPILGDFLELEMFLSGLRVENPD